MPFGRSFLLLDKSYMKLYDQAPVTWLKLPDERFAKYEILRHLLSRKVTQEADEALAQKALQGL